MHVLCLVKWYAGGGWIVARCGNWYVFFAKVSRMRDGSWASNAFTSSCEQVRANRVGDLEDGHVPGGPDDGTGVPSCLHC